MNTHYSKTLLAILLPACLLWGCNTTQTAVIPIVRMETCILMPMEINGHQAYMLWDTGASTSSVTEKSFNQCRMERSNQEVAIAALNSKKLGIRPLSKQEACMLGNLCFSSSFYVRDSANDALDHPIEGQHKVLSGVMGADIINRYYWLFDFVAGRVVVSTHPIPLQLQAPQVMLDFRTPSGDIPYCTVVLNDTLPTTLVFDSGIYGLELTRASGAGLYYDVRVAISDTTSSLCSYFRKCAEQTTPLQACGTAIETGWVFEGLKVNGYDMGVSYISLDVDDFHQRNNEKDSQGYLSANFMRRFTGMYYDPFAQKIHFYQSAAAAELYTGKEVSEFFDANE